LTKPSRIEPLEPPYSNEVADELTRWMPPGSGVDPLALFRILCRNLPLAEAMRPLGSFQLSKRSGLSVRHRELAILRTCARLGASYEWGVHAVAYGAAAGLDAAELEATGEGRHDAFADTDRLVLTFVDALIDEAGVGNALWSVLHQSFSDEQILELTVLCGWYHVISFVCRVAAVPPESWAMHLSGVDGHGIQP
jgi:4-carboxymuconolactone decarboxylase